MQRGQMNHFFCVRTPKNHLPTQKTWGSTSTRQPNPSRPQGAQEAGNETSGSGGSTWPPDACKVLRKSGLSCCGPFALSFAAPDGWALLGPETLGTWARRGEALIKAPKMKKKHRFPLHANDTLPPGGTKVPRSKNTAGVFCGRAHTKNGSDATADGFTADRVAWGMGRTDGAALLCVVPHPGLHLHADPAVRSAPQHGEHTVPLCMHCTRRATDSRRHQSIHCSLLAVAQGC